MTTSAAFGGFDFSPNQPAVPNVGANFGASGPYANYVWLKTIPIDTARKNLEIHNNSTSAIVVVLDDGRASAGQAPTGVSMFSVAAHRVPAGRGASGRARPTSAARKSTARAVNRPRSRCSATRTDD